MRLRSLRFCIFRNQWPIPESGFIGRNASVFPHVGLKNTTNIGRIERGLGVMGCGCYIRVTFSIKGGHPERRTMAFLDTGIRARSLEKW